MVETTFFTIPAARALYAQESVAEPIGRASPFGKQKALLKTKAASGLRSATAFQKIGHDAQPVRRCRRIV